MACELRFGVFAGSLLVVLEELKPPTQHQRMQRFEDVRTYPLCEFAQFKINTCEFTCALGLVGARSLAPLCVLPSSELVFRANSLWS